MTEQASLIRLAATTVLVRNSDQGLETLLLRRNAKLAFAGGAWVFPGGAIDEPEMEVADSEEKAARLAAVREVEEECGLTLATQDLVHFCNWTTPEGEKRRFATWFFVAHAEKNSEDVLIDGGEIHEFRWINPQEAIDLHHLGELTLMPPTYLSMSLISHYYTAEAACQSLAERTPYSVTPRLCQLDGQVMCLYPGDAGYLSNNPAIDGPRHRTSFTSKGMIYSHSGKNVGVVPMDQP